MLLKFGFSLTCKLHKNPSIIEHLIQQADEFLHKNSPPDLPSRPKPKPLPEKSLSAVSTSVNQTSSRDTFPLPSLPDATPTVSHHKTLDFITEAAQELYARGQLRVKPYAKYLKKEHRELTTHSHEDML